MKGTHSLIVQFAHLKYELAFSRNLTVIQGNSATGKTTLVEMISAYNLNGSDTGITVSCDCPVRVIAGNTWKEQLSLIDNSIVLIDEGNRFPASEEFARAIQHTGNYYVIITRESLDNLPYSVTEIYGIRSSGKFQSEEPVYHHLERIYGQYNPESFQPKATLVVEDTNAGYEFFSALSADKGILCSSAGGAGNIFQTLQETSADDITVIADGAAFGSQMNRIYQLMLRRPGVRLYLPESFEWLLLTSDFLRDSEVRSILDNPSAYIDSRNWFSWEQYFTALLTGKSQNTPYAYSKKRLNPVFLKGKVCEQILQSLPDALRVLLQR